MEREATRAAFEKAGVIAMVGDWTRRDEAITDFLTEHGAAGVPFYLWYEPGREGEVLPQVLTANMLKQLAVRSTPGTRGKILTPHCRALSAPRPRRDRWPCTRAVR